MPNDIFIPQAQDMLTPAMNLYKLMQQKKEFELEQQKQGSLQDYHKQMGLQNKMQNVISLAKDQPEAAAQMFNSDPELVQMNKGVPVKFLGVKNEWAHFETDDEGNVTGISKTGQIKDFGKKGKTKTETEANSLEKILADRVAKGDLTLEEAYKLKSTAQPTGTTVNIDTAGKKFWGEMGTETVKLFTKEREAAQESVVGLRTIGEARRNLQAGIYSGSAANIKLGVDKWLQEVGFNIGGEKASNTEAFAAATGKLVGKIIKQFGAGTGLSDADREYAEKIAGGKITLTDESMSKIFEIADRAMRIEIREYNKKAEGIESRPEAKEFPFSFKIEEPPHPNLTSEEQKRLDELRKKKGGQ